MSGPAAPPAPLEAARPRARPRAEVQDSRPRRGRSPPPDCAAYRDGRVRRQLRRRCVPCRIRLRGPNRPQPGQGRRAWRRPALQLHRRADHVRARARRGPRPRRRARRPPRPAGARAHRRARTAARDISSVCANCGACSSTITLRPAPSRCTKPPGSSPRSSSRSTTPTGPGSTAVSVPSRPVSNQADAAQPSATGLMHRASGAQVEAAFVQRSNCVSGEDFEVSLSCGDLPGGVA